MNKKILVECGVEYEEGLKKFMNKTELYDRLLKNFLSENSFELACEQEKAKDYNGLSKSMHAMKSATGTLSMNRLYEMCCKINKDIREGSLNNVSSDFAEAYNEYKKICEGIRTA